VQLGCERFEHTLFRDWHCYDPKRNFSFDFVRKERLVVWYHYCMWPVNFVSVAGLARADALVFEIALAPADIRSIRD
jgi:hypothetical protein